MAVPARVFLHIGLHKTGTTYLQNLLRANRDNLRAQEVDFPAGPDQPVQAFAVWDLQGRRPRGVKDRRIAGQWDALVARVKASDLATVLISEERLSMATLKECRTAVEAFAGSEVRVIVTARDLARITTSAWQEMVKNDAVFTWQEFLNAIKDPAQASSNPARGFWRRQDLVKICETWESVVPADHIHVVTVPPSGAPPGLLLERYASVVGFDEKQLTEVPHWSNETVGVAGVEVIRRVNERLGGRLNQAQYDKVVKLTLVHRLAAATEPVRFAVPESEGPWLSDHAEATIESLRARGYQVAGDLDDLRVRFREDSRRPDEVSDAELLEASLDALALLSETYAKAWWARRQPAVEEVPEKGGLGSRIRRITYAGQRRAADLADRNRLAAKAMGVALKARDRARIRARDKHRV
jgi:hypothetical protein